MNAKPHALLVPTVIASLLAVAGARAADPQAGQVKVQQVGCGECHEAVDFKGKSDAQLTGLIHDVVSGKHKHPKKLQLTDADVANIAAYWSSASK